MLFESLKYFIKSVFGSQTDPFTDNNEELISLPKNVTEQRRRFIRIGCIVPAVFKLDGEEKQGVIVNISGNGVLFVSNESWPREKEIQVNSNIFDREMEFKIIIVREEEALSKLKELYSYGAEITAICEEDRKHIINGVFDSNRWLRQLMV